MLEAIDIPFPMGGIDASQSLEKSNPLTTLLAFNMRGRDPRTGRERGASRAGMVKLVSGTIGTLPQSMIQVTYDRQMTTYTVNESAEDLSVEWAETRATGSQRCDLIALTAGGDIVWISDGKWLVKTNPEGVLVSQKQLPLTIADEEASALVVGSDDAIYVGTQPSVSSAAGVSYAGKVFRYDPDPLDPNALALTWTYEPGGRVASMAEFDDVLYVGINDGPNSSKLLALTELTADPPNLENEAVVAAPIRALAVNEQGEILVASATNPDRGAPPAYDVCGTKSEDWLPTDIGSLADNNLGPLTLRCWLKSEDIADVTDQQYFDVWLDQSGNQRHAFAISGAGAGLLPTQFGGARGARFVRDAFCGFPAARFDQVKDSRGRPPGLASGTGGQRWLPTQDRPYFVTMLVQFRGIGQDQDRGIILQDPGTPFKSLIQLPDVRFAGLGLDDPNGKSVDVSDPDNRTLDVDRDGNEVPAFTDEENQIAILTIAFDPTSNDAGEPMGSLLRVNGKIAGWNLGSNAGATGGPRIEQFTCQNARGDDMACLLGTTPWVNNENANYDLIEMVVVEGRYLWPADMNLGYIDGGAVPTDRASTGGDGHSEIEKVEGYIAHRYGVQSVLTRDSAYPQWGTAVAHPYLAAPPAEDGVSTPDVPEPNEYEAKLVSENGIVAKYAAGSLGLVWAVQGPGLGDGVAARDGFVWSTGAAVAGWTPATGEITDGTTTLRRFVDNGTDPDELDAAAWGASDANYPFFGGPMTMRVDSDLNVYIAGFGTTGGLQEALFKYDATGTQEWLFSVSDYSMNGGGTVALDNFLPNYNADIGEPEFAYVGIRGTRQLLKLRLVDSAYAVGSPRAERYYAFADGDIKEVDIDGDTVTTITGGEDALNAESRIVYPVVMNGQVFVSDGENHVAIDPVSNEASPWRPTTAGRIPRRGRLLEVWRNRAIVGRADGLPYRIVMSAIGNPFDWDTDPPEVLATSAVDLNNSRVGNTPDIVNALIPYSDDLLLIGGDKSIHRLTGDPLDSRSGIDLVTDSVGIAFGRAWCQDNRGRIWFLGTDGSVYVMTPASQPVNVSEPRIDQYIRSVDLSKYTAMLTYDEEQRGVRVDFVPLDPIAVVEGGTQSRFTGTHTSAGEMPVGNEPWTPEQPGANPLLLDTSPTYRDENDQPQVSWFYEFTPDYQGGRWFMDTPPLGGLSPVSLAVLNGDEPDDRTVVMVCKDGHLRKMDPSVGTDDGENFMSSVQFGPLRPRSGARKGRWQNFKAVLGQTTASVDMYVQSADDAGFGEVRQHGPFALAAGGNRAWRKRASGSAVWVTLTAEDGNFWSFERLTAMLAVGGRVRVTPND